MGGHASAAAAQVKRYEKQHDSVPSHRPAEQAQDE
jgi:hypothetical protein